MVLEYANRISIGSELVWKWRAKAFDHHCEFKSSFSQIVPVFVYGFNKCAFGHTKRISSIFFSYNEIKAKSHCLENTERVEIQLVDGNGFVGEGPFKDNGSDLPKPLATITLPHKSILSKFSSEAMRTILILVSSARK